MVQIQRSPVRVSPCEIVLVAISPKLRPVRSEIKRSPEEMSDEVSIAVDSS